MVPEKYLELGLIGLGRGGQHNWFNGHYGAALLAAYFMDREHELPTHVQEGLVRTCEHYIEQHPDWFTPFENETTDPSLMEQVFAWLGKNLEQLRSSGHGLALGVLGLKALLKRPDLCTTSVVDGLCKTLDRTTQDGGNRYYGIANYFDVTIDDVQDVPEYHSSQDMIQQAFDEMDILLPGKKIGEKFYHFTGEPEHGVTHAQALVELERLGYGELTKQGMINHRIQMHLNRQRPEELLDTQITDPGLTSIFDPTYWAKTFNDPHGIKVPYAALSLFKRLPVEARAKAEFNTLKILCQVK